MNTNEFTELVKCCLLEQMVETILMEELMGLSDVDSLTDTVWDGGLIGKPWVCLVYKLRELIEEVSNFDNAFPGGNGEIDTKGTLAGLLEIRKILERIMPDIKRMADIDRADLER